MRRRPSKFAVVAVAVGLVFTVLGGSPLASSEVESNAAATMGCERRAGWQRWYATPSEANAVGVWACGWYNSTIYDVVGRVWDTDPDSDGAYLVIDWGDGKSEVVTGTPEGRLFSFLNPDSGAPPKIRECVTKPVCGQSVRVDYLPERNKLAGVFRVMTYNIHHGYTYEKERFEDWCKDLNTDNTDLWKTASTIRRNDPDIVIVNEIHKVLEVGGKVCHIDNQPQKLAQTLGMNYVYCNDWDIPVGSGECNHNATTRNSGNAILSRYPITFKGHLGLPHNENAERAKRGLIWAEVAINNTRIPVYATHLVAGHDTPENDSGKDELRQDQLTAIVKKMASNGHYPLQTKMILAGDMNTGDVRELSVLGHSGRGFNDGFKHISPDWKGATIPVRESRGDARHRVDYIFTSPLFEHPPRGTAVPWSQSSDHLPVIVDMYQ